MKFKMLSFVGYMFFILFFHSASSQPFELQKLSSVEALINDDNPSHPALNLLQQSYNTKNDVQRSVLPSGYVDFSGCDGIDIKLSSYKIHHTRKTWNDAREACINEGGYLGYPECPEEARKYHEILKYVNNGGAWIGFHDFYVHGDWVTIFGKSVNELEYVNWAEDQPDYDDDEKKKCAQIGEDGSWYNKQCDTELFFICKIDV